MKYLLLRTFFTFMIVITLGYLVKLILYPPETELISLYTAFSLFPIGFFYLRIRAGRIIHDPNID